jgi:hypothetical protein
VGYYEGVAVILIALLVVLLVAVALVLIEIRSKHVANWLASYIKGRWVRDEPQSGPRHLVFCFVDHFEPMFERPDYAVECARVARWHTGYPRLCEGHRDSDGRPPVHTFFYPEEEYRPEHLEPLVDLCRRGFGEIEVHLHHDDDTEAGLRSKLQAFTRILIDRHDALPVDSSGRPQWAFIHGNWALDNSRADGRWCGVNNELKVLREEGCYADFTFPSAPSDTQPPVINSIYYAAGRPGACASHWRDPVQVQTGGAESGDLMIVQGALGISWHSRKFGLIPRIENSDIRSTSPPTRQRIDQWVKTGIQVKGRPEWVFVKIHTHGAPERDVEMLLGPQMSDAHSYLESRYNDGEQWRLHYVSAREMYNIIKAAEAGETGNPGNYRDYLIPRPTYGQK